MNVVSVAVSTAEQTEPPVFQTADAAVKVARNLGPRIAAKAEQTEIERMVSADTIFELKKTGLFGLTTPKEYGGSALGFSAVVQVTAELARHCGSTGWVFGVLAGHSWLLNYFPTEVQRQVYGDGRALAATVFRLNGKAVKEADGVRITDGIGRFCSGIDHADWIVVGISVQDSAGAVEPHFAIVPKSAVQVQDDWFTVGMRGTGSRTICIKDAVVPHGWLVPFAKMDELGSALAKKQGKEVYAIPWNSILPYSLIGAPIGMARGALNSFVEGLKSRVEQFTPQQQAEQSATFARLAACAADIEAALTVVLADAQYCDGIEDGTGISRETSARLANNWAWAAQKSRYAATQLFEAAGGSGIYNSSVLQRFWRDVNSAAQHIAFTWDGAMATYGRALLELPVGQFGVKGR